MSLPEGFYRIPCLEDLKGKGIKNEVTERLSFGHYKRAYMLLAR
jgi:hypothetical protein